jgi:hypothetical protein
MSIDQAKKLPPPQIFGSDAAPELEGEPVSGAKRQSRFKPRGRRPAEPKARLRAVSDGATFGTTDTSGLPPELLKELRRGGTDRLEQQIIAVFEACGGTADLDQLLIGLFRKFGVVQKRRFLQNKLWRMVRKEQLHTLKEARGVFRLASAKKRHREKKRD